MIITQSFFQVDNYLSKLRFV